MDESQDHPAVQLGRRAFAAGRVGDWETIADLFAVDYIKRDHRALGMPPIRGRDARVTESQTTHEAYQLTEQYVTLLATKGDRLALADVRYDTAAGYELHELMVVRLDDDGRMDLQVNFDVDDLVDARAEFDRIAAELEG